MAQCHRLFQFLSISIVVARNFVTDGRRVQRNPSQIAPAGAVAKFERHFIPFLHPPPAFPLYRKARSEEEVLPKRKNGGKTLSLSLSFSSLVSRLPSPGCRRRRDTSLVRERASDRCELRRRGLCKREWFLSTGREIDRESRARVASGVDDDGDGAWWW